MHSTRVTDVGSGLQRTAGWLCTRPARPRYAARGSLVTVCASMCPYTTLGVSAGASDTEIKQAYRKLVLQYHPDVNHAGGAERRFMSIQQAYELLTSKSRHPEGQDGRRSDWAFHDWYWSFSQKRRWNSQRQAAARSSDSAYHPPQQETTSAFHKQPQHQATLRSQLAGLRHRAAIRANKPKQAFAGQAASSNKEDVAEATPASSACASSASASSSTTASSSASDDVNTSIEYAADMSDGCNVGFRGVTDWQATEQQQAQRQRFTATETHKQQVMQQMAGLHRRAAVAHSLGDWP